MGDSSLNHEPGATEPASAPGESPRPAKPSLTVQVVHGSAWNVVGTLVQKVLGLAASVVVARLLLPTDYAIAGLAASVMGVFFTLTAQGFAQALIQRKELTDLTRHSVFWFMTVAGMGLGTVTMALSPLLAQFYGQPALVPVMVVLAGGLVVSMIGAVPNALLQRAMRFREINLIGILGSLLSAVLGVGAAWLGYGYWALILPGLGATLFMAVRAFWLSGYRPARQFRWSEIRVLSAFGFSMLGSNLVQYFSDNSDYLIMSRFWSKVDFGQYYFAFERSRQPFNLVIAQLDRVLFPVFSRIQDDVERLRRAFLRGTHSVCLLIFPLHVLLIGLADPLVPWIFSEQWRPAVPVFQVYAAFAFVRGLAALVSSGMLAINRAQAVLAFNVFRVVIAVPTLLYLGISGATILQTALVMTVIWCVQAPFLIGYFYKQLHLPVVEAWRSMRGLIGITVAMGAVLAGCRLGAAAVGWPAWVNVTLSGLLSSALFGLLARRPLLDLFRQVRLALRGKQELS